MRVRGFTRLVLLGGLALSLIAATVSWRVGSSLVAPARRAVGDPPASLPVATVEVVSEGATRLAGWHLDAPGERGVVVLLHGIRGDRRAMWPRMAWLHGLGFSSLAIDFRAHGESEGERITGGHHEREDAQAAVAFAMAAHPSEPVAVLGVSMGGAAALLAGPLGVDAMVLESVYPDFGTAVRHRVAARLGALAGPPTWVLLMQVRWRLGVDPGELRPLDHIADVDCPVLVVSGANDAHTTAEETRVMFGTAQEPKAMWLVPDAGHVDLFDASGDAYRIRVGAFLERWMDAATAR